MNGFTKTKFANLYRSEASGTYFVIAKVAGRLVRKSLKTKVPTSAKLRLDKELCLARAAYGGRAPDDATNLSMGAVMEVYESGVVNSVKLKPRAKDFRKYCLARVKKTWPELEKLQPSNVRRAACMDFCRKTGASPRIHNGMLECLGKLFDEAITLGAATDNPALKLDRKAEPVKRVHFPAASKIEAMIRRVEASSPEGALLARLLMGTGMRIEEATKLPWSAIDWDNAQIHIPAEIAKGSHPRTIPMIAEAKVALEALKTVTAGKKCIAPVKTCRKALATACAAEEIDKLGHHSLRHYFATRCIESGVDIPTVSRWLGHQDGGALAMRVYGHLRDEHSQAMAAKVRIL